MHNFTECDLAGMTVNERLSVCNLIDDWDKAVDKRDKLEMIIVLRKALFSKEQSAETTKSVLDNPTIYGY